MIRFTKRSFLLAFFFSLAGVAVAAPKTVQQCINLLHANYRVLKLGFKKIDPPAEGQPGPSGRISLAAGSDENHFYGADGFVLGRVDARTGKVTPMYRAKRGERVQNIASNDTHVSAHLRTDDDQQKMIGKVFVDRKTGAVTRAKIPENAVISWNSATERSTTLAYVAGDELRLFDIVSAKTRKLTLPFVPTQLYHMEDAAAAIVAKPGRPLLAIDVRTGEKLEIPGLGKIHLGDARHSGYHLMSFDTTRLHMARAGHSAVLEIDLAARRIRSFQAPEPDLEFRGFLGDGEFIHYERRPRPVPSDLTDEERLAWAMKNRDSWSERSWLVEAKTGKAVFKNTAFQPIRTPDGKGFALKREIMRRMETPDGEEAYFLDGTDFYVWNRENGFLHVIDHTECSWLEAVYDRNRQTWMASVNPSWNDLKPGAEPPKDYVAIFDRNGKLVQRLEDFKYDLAQDSNDAFLGFYAGEFRGGKDLIRIALPDFATAAKRPVGGWAKAAKVLAQPMTALEARKNYPYLMAFFESTAYRKHPKQAAGAFLNVLNASNGYTADLLARFADLESILARHPLPLEKLSVSERRRWKALALNYVKLLRMGDIFGGGHMGHIRALSPFLKAFTPAQAEEFVDLIAETAKVRAQNELPDLRDVFPSKVYKIIRRNIAGDFDIHEAPITDATAVQDGEKLTLMALGSNEIEGGARTRFGLTYKKLREVEIPKDAGKNQVLVDDKFAWRHAGKRYTVEFTAQTTSKTLDDIVEFTNGPNYPAHWKDGKFTTLVMPGSNLFDDAKTTMDEYLSYFQDRGYEFEKGVRNLGDVQKFLQENIEGGHVDMFIKEAHSDGDEKNLFRIFKTSDMMTGRKKLADGREETVYLIYPDKTATSGESNELTRLIPNAEFGLWMRNRDKTATPFLYLNVSCSSYSKAAAEIQEALTKTLVDIASKNLMDTFTNEPESAMLQLMESILEGRTYSQTKKAMERNPDNKAGIGNNVVFPDAADPDPYRESVLKGLRIPISTKVQVFDPHGKPVDIDAHGH